MNIDSIAVYLEKNSTARLSVNINVWTDCKKNNYIDIGLHLNNHKKPEKCYLYLPYKISNRDIQDLYDFYKRESVAKGLQNNVINIVRYGTVTVINGNALLPLNEDMLTIQDIKGVNSNDDGCSISLIIAPSSGSSKSVTAFRIPDRAIPNAINEYGGFERYTDSIQSPIISVVFPYELRINDIRSLPIEIVRLANHQTIETLNVFINAPKNVSILDTGCKRVRIIERNVFGEFLPSKSFELYGRSYQWFRKRIKNSIVSTEISFSRTNMISMLLYSLIIVLLNLLSNFIYSFIS